MAREKKAAEADHSQDWLATYSDMITLVLTFFVLLYSMSTVDEVKWQLILQAFQSKGNVVNPVVSTENPPDFLGENVLIGDSNGEAETGNSGMPKDMDELFQYLVSEVADNGLDTSISVAQGKDKNIFMRFKDKAFFSPNSEILKAEGKVILDFIADGLRGVSDDIASIKVNGHTADPQGGLSDISDRRLSSGRADSVAIYFDMKEFIDPGKIVTAGYGKNHPIDDNSTEEGKAANRRVELIIMQNGMDLSDPETLKQYLAMNYDLEDNIDPESMFTIPPPPEEEEEVIPSEPPPPIDIVEALTPNTSTDDTNSTSDSTGGISSTP